MSIRRLFPLFLLCVPFASVAQPRLGAAPEPRREREAGTTGSSDQASARRQELLEQMQRAGC